MTKQFNEENISFSKNNAEATRYTHAKTMKLYPYCGRLNNVPRDIWFCFLENINVILIGKRIFAVVIKLRVLICRYYFGLSGWAPNVITSILLRKR